MITGVPAAASARSAGAFRSRGRDLRSGRAFELASVAGLVVVLAVVAYGIRVREGGFSYDAWSYAVRYLIHAHGGTAGSTLAPLAGHRPINRLLATAFYTAFGLHSILYLVAGEVLLGIMAISAYVFFRALGLRHIDATAIALLGWLFPFADSLHMIATWSIPSLGVTAYFLGSASALLALRSEGRRAASLHALAVLLYVCSVLTYEIAAGPILLSALLYRTAVPWAKALRRGLLDVAVIAPVLLVMLVVDTSSGSGNTQAYSLLSSGGSVHHAIEIAAQAVGLLSLAMFPPGGAVVTKTAVLISGVLAATTVAALALVTRRLTRFDSRAREQAVQWLRVACGGLIGAGAAYLIFVPGIAYYHPLGHGDVNRMNVLAAFGMAAFVYAIARIVGIVAAKSLDRSSSVASGIAVVLAVAVGGLYVTADREDAQRWVTAMRRQRAIFAEAHRAIPLPPRHSTILLEGALSQNKVSPGVYAFSVDGGDLSAAIEVSYRDPSLLANPVVGPGAAKQYLRRAPGPVFLLNLPNGTAHRIG